ncbi:hypothetical protein XO10_02795 [Marinitoga sp. 1135]|uniref:DUF2089 domain-containing protein n=1 Tax=Marinitoga piezophila (strain DSM 14283 / JCM 11233 / KA3) TaxID=443254 RepID=H2J5C9_MARPK|nr:MULTISPECIES: DUF2089 domain-containing protein [Marinitoga]AEX84987.1 hypothetical protein Marpi_0546 [Marinitoga piezophila KA3]APT75492.1 hypothetical protein LN42_03110 [Marinitoga sp. 1137]NUU95216.1 hypothetical protein [Marinitoga sp. 1135]NUU97149.1 hypothetical protein [Marinitoga sp. 1138]
MKKKRLTRCPVCGGDLVISEFRCPTCDITIKGSFHLDDFAKLSDEQLYFLKIFIKNRGNLSDVQKEIGISYPTAKARLEGVVRAMGFDEKKNTVDTLKILEKIEKGELTPEEAKEILKGKGNKE